MSLRYFYEKSESVKNTVYNQVQRKYESGFTNTGSGNSYGVMSISNGQYVLSDGPRSVSFGGTNSTPAYYITEGVNGQYNMGVNSGVFLRTMYSDRRYVHELVATTVDAKGSFIETIVGGEASYPINGKHSDGFWYIRKSIVQEKHLFKDGEVLKTLLKGTPDAHLVPAMSSNTSPSPIVISTTNGFVDAWKWFDGVSQETTSGTKAIDMTIDLGSGRRARLDKLVILTNSSVRKPNMMDLYGSNDGSSFDLLHQRSDASRTFTDITIDLTVKGMYRYYRIHVRSIVDSYWVLTMNQIRLIGEYESTWEALPESTLSEELFSIKGMSDLSIVSSEDLKKLSSDQIEVLSWTNEISARRSLHWSSAPTPKIVVPANDIQLSEAGGISINWIRVGVNTDIKVVVSEDAGTTWMGKNQVDITDLASVKENGFTPEELNALTKDQLTTLFPNGTARFAFYLEQDNLTDVVEIQSLTINEKKYTISPTVSDISVIYEVLKSEQPKLFISRDDGVTWKEVSQDEMVSLSDQPDGNQLRVKALLADGQEVQAISYSWA